jgi:putative membrane protein
LILRLLLTSFSIYVAARLVDGVSLRDPWEWWHLLLIGGVFGLLNAVVKPIVVFFSLPALILTVGLFYFVINALILWMTPLFVPMLVVEGFVAAFKGSIVITLVNWVFSWLVGVRS